MCRLLRAFQENPSTIEPVLDLNSTVLYLISSSTREEMGVVSMMIKLIKFLENISKKKLQTLGVGRFKLDRWVQWIKFSHLSLIFPELLIENVVIALLVSDIVRYLKDWSQKKKKKTSQKMKTDGQNLRLMTRTN